MGTVFSTFGRAFRQVEYLVHGGSVCRDDHPMQGLADLVRRVRAYLGEGAVIDALIVLFTPGVGTWLPNGMLKSATRRAIINPNRHRPFFLCGVPKGLRYFLR